MNTLVKTGAAVVMGLLLALSLLTTGVSAQNVTTHQKGVTHSAVTATAPQVVSQPLVATRGQQATQVTRWGPGFHGGFFHHRHFYHRWGGGWGWGWGGCGGCC